MRLFWLVVMIVLAIATNSLIKPKPQEYEPTTQQAMNELARQMKERQR